ncbi:MAG: hypothetical protein ACXWU2_09610, partial [Allosphingosinicella sp.]
SLDAGEWRALNVRFDDESRMVLRTAKLALLILFPATFAYAMTLGQIIPGAGIVILAAIFLGPPAIYLWQSHKVARIARNLDAELAGRLRVAAPPIAPPRALRVLEIACLLVVGPHLILQVYGSLNPNAYRNTPLLGTELDWSGLAGFLVLATILFLRWRPKRPARRTKQAEHRVERRFDPLARARETGS